MSTTAFVRSELLYKAPRATEMESTKPRLAELIQAGVDFLIEYPGSKKGEFGEWRLTDWVDGKIQQIASRGGVERR